MEDIAIPPTLSTTHCKPAYMNYVIDQRPWQYTDTVAVMNKLVIVHMNALFTS